MVERRRACLIDTQLHDRNVSLRKHMAQHRPAAVVEPPGLIGENGERREEALHARRQGGLSGRRIAHLVQLDRKSTRLNSRHLVISYAAFCLKKKSRSSSQ